MSDVREALLACVRDHPWSAAPAGIEELLTSRLAVQQLVAAARWHRVEGSVWLSLRDCGSGIADAPELQALAADHAASVAAHLRTVYELRVVDQIMRAAGISYAILKGPVLAELCYERPDLRRYSDLDILVGPLALPDAVDLLERHGYRLLDANWDMLVRLRVGEIHLASPTGITIDLHWDLISDATLRSRFRISTAGLLDRALDVQLGGSRTSVLAPVDHLVHVAVHAGSSGADRLGWLKDVEQSMMRRPIDWQEVDERVAEWRVLVAVGTVVDRTQRVLPGPLLEQARARLDPGPVWRVLARGIDRISPPTATSDHGSLARMFARAARGSTAASLAELARRAVSWGASTLPSSGGRVGTVLDAKAPTSVLFPSGRRTEFFAEIARAKDDQWT